MPTRDEMRSNTVPAASHRKRKREEQLFGPFVSILDEVARTSTEVSGNTGQFCLREEWITTYDRAPDMEHGDDILLPSISFTYLEQAADMKK